MIKNINRQDVENIKSYIDGLQKFYDDENKNGYNMTTQKMDFVIDGYEKMARPYIDFFNMNDPKRMQTGSDLINYNNDAELCTIWYSFSHVGGSINFLKRVKARMERYLSNPEEFKNLNNDFEVDDALSNIQNILNRFHSLTKSVTERRKGKTPYSIEDEYDVQDLLFSIFKSHYQYADRESPASSVGKGSTVIDIVIPEHSIVIEIKIIKETSKEKSIIEELKIDFESYFTHKACKNLIAFIYDPNTVIKDPDKIINDLSGNRTKGDKTFDVFIVISPK
jgi:hypothetical protein